MSKWAFFFTIGSVQDFIAFSRKISDLWAGSFMLSYLIAQGIKALPENYKLIFPSRDNKLLGAKYNEDILKTSLPNKFLAKFETAEEIEKIAQNVKTAIENAYIKIREYATEEIGLQDDWLDFAWAACKIEDKSDKTLQTYLGKELSLVKLFRTIKTKPSSEKGFKCTLCGVREQISKNSKYYKLNLPNQKTNESLCSVCAAKRAFPKFLAFEYKIEQKFGKDSFSTQDFDDKYYAIIFADGDDMGKWMSGEKGGLASDAVSRKLLNFSDSLWNEKSVSKEKSYLIYCGGDDVLLFANLKDSLVAAKKVQELFKEKFSKETGMSAGIHISHGKDSLNEALINARKAEEQSKRTQNKNTFTVSISKRSGGDISWTASGYEDIDYLEEVIDCLAKEILSPSFAFQLKEEFKNIGKDEFPKLKDIIRKRINFLLDRHIHIENNIKKNVVNNISIIVNKFSFDTRDKFDKFLNFCEIAMFFARRIKEQDKNNTNAAEENNV